MRFCRELPKTKPRTVAAKDRGDLLRGGCGLRRQCRTLTYRGALLVAECLSDQGQFGCYGLPRADLLVSDVMIVLVSE